MSDYEDIMDLLGPSVAPFEPSSQGVSRPAPPTVRDTTSEANVWLPTSVAAHYKEYDRSGRAVDELEEQIRQQGLLTPIRISTDGEVAVVHEGNHRLQVADRLGIREVPVIVTLDSRVVSNGGRVTPLEPVLASWVDANRGSLRSFWGHRTALSAEDRVSVAEEVMERAGHAGRTFVVPVARRRDAEPLGMDPIELQREYSREAEQYVAQVLGRPGIKVEPMHWDLRNGGGQALTDGMNYIGLAGESTNELTLLHEIAHIILRTSEGRGGHGPEFQKVVHQLYAEQLGQAAADTFAGIVWPEGVTARIASSDIIARGFKFDEVGFELAQKYMNGTMTGRDILQEIERKWGSVGIWWGSIGPSGDDFYGSASDAQDYAGWAGDGSIEHRWEDMLRLTGGEVDSSEWMDAEIRVVLVAKKPMRDYGMWNPTTENGEGSMWESTSYFEHGERLELVEIQYAADREGDIWESEAVGGLTVTAQQKLGYSISELPNVGPTPDSYWGEGGCGYLAIAFQQLVPELKIAVEWDRRDHTVNHAWVYGGGKFFDYMGTETGGPEAWSPYFSGGEVEFDVDPQEIASSMGFSWSPSSPWENDMVFEASQVIERHWGLYVPEDDFDTYASRTAGTYTYYHNTSNPAFVPDPGYEPNKMYLDAPEGPGLYVTDNEEDWTRFNSGYAIQTPGLRATFTTDKPLQDYPGVVYSPGGIGQTQYWVPAEVMSELNYQGLHEITSSRTAGTEDAPGPVYRGLNVSVLDYDEQQDLAEWANANAFSLYDYQLAEPNYELVYKVLDRLDSRGLGRHWSKDYDVAADFARDQGDGIQLILIGDWDGNGVDTREFHRGYDDVLRPSNLEHEKEVTLLPGSRITLVGMDVVNEDGFTHNIPVPNLMVTAGRTAGDYFMQHRPAGPDYGGQMHDVSDFFPDIETLPTRMYDFGEPGSQGSIRQIIDAQGNPSKSVTIYRAVPKGADPVIRDGDWVTISREYAEQHGMSNVNGVYDILSATVQAQDIWTDGNSVNEFGYWGPELRTARTYTASVEDGSEFLRTPGAKIDWTPAEAPFDGIWFGFNGRDQTFASYFHAGIYDEEDYLLSKAWSDERIAKLQWTPSGEVAIIWTKMDYRRIGLATALFNWTKANIFPGLQHSNDMTSSGYEWAKSMGHDPEDWELMRTLPHYAASAGKLYRGVRIDLGVDLSLAQPGSSIETVGQELQLGPLVLDALSQQGGLGTHWSTRPEIAERFALESSGNGGGTPVLVTVDWDGSGEDLERTDTGGTWTDEAEVTLLPGTPITVTSIILGSSFSNGIEILHSDRYLGYASDFAAAGLPVPQGGPQRRTAEWQPWHSDDQEEAQEIAHGTTIYRGMKVVLSDADLEQIRRWQQIPLVEEERGQHFNIGPFLLERLEPLGIHWTTKRRIAEISAMQGGGYGGSGIIIEAEYNGGQDLRGTAYHTTDWSSEEEITMLPGAQVRVTKVFLTGIDERKNLLREPRLITAKEER